MYCNPVFENIINFPLQESGQTHLIHPHPWMTEWCQNDKIESFQGHFKRNGAGMKCFHPCHSNIISSFEGHSYSEWPTNDKKSHSTFIPVTSPNLTFVCTIFLQTLWQAQAGLKKWGRNDLRWCWNDIGMMKWLKNDLNDLGMTWMT